MDQLPELTLLGISIIVWIAFTTQFFKELLTWDGVKAKLLAFVVSAFYAGLAYAEAEGLLAGLQPWGTLVLYMILFGINATGGYQLVGTLTKARK